MKFNDININKYLKAALAKMSLTDMTTIQERAFPVAMSGRDVLGIAQTGTGKTIGYLLPCLNMWRYTKNNPPQILVLVPTRELVTQVLSVAEALAEGTDVKCVGVFGGAGMMPQAERIAQGADVLIGTPGRLLDLALDGYVNLKTVKRLVVDEVDEMLEQGFRTQLGRVFDLLPKKRQSLLFSATMTDDIESILDIYFNDPVKIEAAPTGTPLQNISQSVFEIPNYNTKINFLRHTLSADESMTKVLIFVGSIALADRVFEALQPSFGEAIDYIHSKRTQSQRFGAIRNFTSGETRILIATDVVARGIDICNVSHVVNFDLPDEPEQYMHRIGRTGRADRNGISLALVAPYESQKLADIEKLMGITIDRAEMPEDVAVNESLVDFEQPNYRMRNTLVETAATPGRAFHQKLEKNTKVNVKRRPVFKKDKKSKPKRRK